MNYLSLFSGVGGGDLGLQHLLGWRCYGYVEWDKYCCRVLEQRIKDGLLSDAPIFCGDIREWIANGYAASYQGMVGAIAGGFPCQPFSVAGKRAGADDPRNMWPATVECLRIIRPRFALLENVPGLLATGYFDTIIGELTESGYDTRWRVLSAAEVGAPHKRDRLWIVAHASSTGAGLDSGRDSRSSGQRRQPADTPQPTLVRQGDRADRAEGLDSSSGNVPDASSTQRRSPSQLGQYRVGRQYALPQGRHESADGLADLCETVAHATVKGLEGEQRAQLEGAGVRPTDSSWWKTEPDIRRVANGVAARVDRLKALGNGQVPLVAATAWRLLTEDLL